MTLAGPVIYGDIVTVSYTASSNNPIQTSHGGLAKDIISKPVTNNCIDPNKPKDPPVVIINSPETVYGGFVSEIDASSSYAANNDPLKVNWNIPDNIPASAADSLKTRFLSPVVDQATALVFKLNVSDANSLESKVVTINVLPYKPSLVAAKITGIEASDFQTHHTPSNAADSDITTYWSSNGDKQWLLLKLAEPFKISYIELAFLIGQHYQSYFDIYASKDNLTWDSILTHVASCNFSGKRQVFDFPSINTHIDYSYVKYVGHGNLVDMWNRVSDIKIYGSPRSGSGTELAKIVVFPNPTTDMINISIIDQSIKPDKVRIVDPAGKVLFEKVLDPENRNIEFPIILRSGVYLLALASGNLVLVTQRIIVKS